MNDAIARRLLKKRDITTGGDSLISLNSLPQNPFTDSRRNAEQSKKLNNGTGLRDHSIGSNGLRQGKLISHERLIYVGIGKERIRA